MNSLYDEMNTLSSWAALLITCETNTPVRARPVPAVCELAWTHRRELTLERHPGELGARSKRLARVLLLVRWACRHRRPYRAVRCHVLVARRGARARDSCRVRAVVSARRLERPQALGEPRRVELCPHADDNNVVATAVALDCCNATRLARWISAAPRESGRRRRRRRKRRSIAEITNLR
jgi:hypothetical protein